MSRNRMMLFLALVAGLAVAAGGFFLGIQPQLSSASANEAQRQSTDSTNAATQQELNKLAEENKTLDQQKAALADLRQSVPDSASASAFYRELNAIGGTAGVKITSITTGDPTAYAPPTKSTDSSAATGPLPVTDPAVTASNFSIIPVTVGITGTFDQARAFMKGVQTGDRLFLLTNITSSAESTDGTSTTTWTIGGSIYVLTDDAATASATASPSASATPAAG